jgi:signal transduction histidine kinase
VVGDSAFSERKQIEEALRESEAILSDQRPALELIAAGAPLREVLHALEAFVEAGPTAGRCAMEVGARLARMAVERAQAEETRKLKIQSLLKHMAEGVIAVDEEQRIIMVNPAVISLLGLTGVLESLPLAEAALPRQLERSLVRVCQQERGAPTTITFACGPVAVLANISPVLTPQGEFRGAIALLRDQTAQAQFRKLQESLVANVSHEIRGPLTALSAMVEALADGVLPEGVQPRYLKAMLAEIGRLRRLTADLLELSRLDAGIVALSPITFSVDILVEGLAERWLARCVAADLALEIQAPPVLVIGDPDRVEQVLTSFLDNAVRFTPRGGHIALFARVEGPMVRLGVSDSGPGIGPEHLLFVWERFYKADQARSRTSESGTGLGLAIAKHWVEQMGGTVAVESTPGEGSSFSFTLPAAPKR